ncbi:MAG: EAL domain-containing protein [Clostridia bacterium]|nr:EAL domain-containing protein [Clostridia bacterium]
MATVKETVESGITPIILEFSEVKLFDSNEKIVRSFLTVNSLDIGVLGYAQYRFVARRTKVGNHLVRRHLEKLFRALPTFLDQNPDVSAVTVPVYARLLADSELANMLVDLSALYPEIPLSKICIELSADILYEELSAASEKIDELRALGVKVAICEVGDQFCPVFRLSEIKFDYAFMDAYSTASLDGDSADRIAGSLVKYLHYLDVRVIAPGLDTEAKIKGARAVGADGYTEDKEIERTIEEGVKE